MVKKNRVGVYNEVAEPSSPASPYDATITRMAESDNSAAAWAHARDRMAWGTSAGVLNSNMNDLLYDRWILHQNHQIRQWFDVAVGFVLIYNMLVIPFRVSFDSQATGFFYVFEFVLDAIFWVDILLNFRTAVIIDEDVLLTDPWEIAKNYFQKWFFIDLVSAFPFDLLFQERNRNYARIPKILRMLRLLRLIRLMQMFRLSRLYRKWQAHLNINSSIFNLIKLLIVSFLVAHLMACAWFLLALFQIDHEDTWAGEHELWEKPTYVKYLYSIYWAVMTITTVGYGDVVAITEIERIFVVVGMVVGVTFFSYAVGMMSYLVQRMKGEDAQDRMDQLNTYFTLRKVPQELRVAIRQHYLFAYSRRQAVLDERRIFGELSLALRTQLAMHLKETALSSSRFFRDLSENFATEMVGSVEPEAAAPGDFVVRAGQLFRKLYLISHGSVILSNADGSHVFMILHAGDFFGDSCLFNPSAPSPFSVRAATYCELDTIDLAVVRDSLAVHPEDEERLRVMIVNRRRKTNLRLHKRRGSVTPDAAGRLGSHPGDMLNIIALGIRDEDAGVSRQTIAHCCRRHESVFSGSDAVSWMVDHYPLEFDSDTPEGARELAVAMGNRMIERGFFRHYLTEELFIDSPTQFYTFLERSADSNSEGGLPDAMTDTDSESQSQAHRVSAKFHASHTNTNSLHESLITNQPAPPLMEEPEGVNGGDVAMHALLGRKYAEHAGGRNSLMDPMYAEHSGSSSPKTLAQFRETGKPPILLGQQAYSSTLNALLDGSSDSSSSGVYEPHNHSHNTNNNNNNNNTSRNTANTSGGGRRGADSGVDGDTSSSSSYEASEKGGVGGVSMSRFPPIMASPSAPALGNSSNKMSVTYSPTTHEFGGTSELEKTSTSLPHEHTVRVLVCEFVDDPDEHMRMVTVRPGMKLHELCSVATKKMGYLVSSLVLAEGLRQFGDTHMKSIPLHDAGDVAALKEGDILIAKQDVLMQSSRLRSRNSAVLARSDSLRNVDLR